MIEHPLSHAEAAHFPKRRTDTFLLLGNFDVIAAI
jgi:hypothetical protein